jgi:AMIN domain
MSDEDKKDQKTKRPPSADPFGNQSGWGSFDDVSAQEDWGNPADTQSATQPPQPPAAQAPQPPAAPAPQPPVAPAPQPPVAPALQPPVAPAPQPPAAPVPQPPVAPAPQPPVAPAPQPPVAPAPQPPVAPAPQPPAAPAPPHVAAGPAPTAAMMPAYGSATALAVENKVSVPILLIVILGFLVTAAFSSVVFIADYSRIGEEDTELDITKTRKLLLAITDKGKIDRVKVVDEQPLPEPSAAGNHAKEIVSITVETEVSATTVTINTDGPVSSENHFKMDNPDRLVMDILGIEQISVSSVSGDGTRLDRVRIGKHDDKVRLVFDLNYSVDVAVDSQPNKLVIRLSD